MDIDEDLETVTGKMDCTGETADGMDCNGIAEQDLMVPDVKLEGCFGVGVEVEFVAEQEADKMISSLVGQLEPC